jgi:hypothetical protein
VYLFSTIPEVAKQQLRIKTYLRFQQRTCSHRNKNINSELHKNENMLGNVLSYIVYSLKCYSHSNCPYFYLCST